MLLTRNDFCIIRDYVKKACGITLADDKEYLVEQRLESIALDQGCQNFTEFALMMRACRDPGLRDQVIVAITTNETSFFRDIHPFDAFRDTIFPQLAAIALERKQRTNGRKGSKVSIWCAASSTGQEPYCLSIIIHDYLQLHPELKLAPDDFSIVASDISSQVLAQAIAGIYSEMEAGRGLTESQKNAYFTRQNSKLIVKDYLRKILDFRRLNLNESFLHLGGFDAIYCRNVLIYFDVETRQRIFDQFFQLLTQDGFLVLGSTENIYGVSNLFESRYAGPSVYYTKKKN